jgi:penicillin amidase
MTRARRRGILALSVLTLAAVASAGGWLWHVSRAVVPPLDGQIALPGLHAPVEVLFDRWGVPHVYARDADDAWMAAGYLQARDRLWKMELYRRAAAGRLSEIFGEITLPADRRFIALRLRRAAAAEWAAASPRVQRALERHAAGVNAFASRLGRWNRPLEFQLMGIAPEPWTPVDSLAIGKLMAWRLAENRRGELVRGALARKFGVTEANRLMGGMPAWAPSIVEAANAAPARPAVVQTTADVGGGESIAGSLRRGQSPRTGTVPAWEDARSALDAALPPGLEWLALTSRAAGSNSWVIHGSRTASGRPLLANDPHLGIEMPSIWYEMHLVAADLDVAGVTIPGAPFVIIGHNQKIAWGLTNSGADVQDFYVEDVDFARKRYRYAGGWEPLVIERREITVRGRSQPEPYDIVSTRHGPIVALENDWEEVPVFGGAAAPASRPLALRWDSVARGESAGAFEAINRAGSWQEFVDAVRRFGAPSQNFVYADVAGNIGYAMSGELPVRAAGDGSLPTPGWTGASEWIGAITPDRLPALLNPPSGRIVTANAEIDRGWPGSMTRDWTAPFRTTRILAEIGDRTDLDMNAAMELQRDIRSPMADRLMDALERASQGPAMKRAEAEARTAVDRLRLWDRRVDGRPVVTLYEAFVRALWRRTFADDLDAALFTAFTEYGLAEYYAGVLPLIDDPDARWWDDIATVDRRERRDDILLLAAADALIELRKQFGDEANWSWERIHAAHFTHPLGAGGRVLGWFFSRGPVPVTGDSWTVQKNSVDRRRPYGVGDVASYRQVIDVGAWDNTRAVNTTGQSGHARSPHYFDQNPLWARGEYRPFPFSRAAVEQARVARLLLVQGGR